MSKFEERLKILDEAMDEQVKALARDPHNYNPFTRNRVIQIWQWRKDAINGLEPSEPIKFFDEAI